MARRFLVPLVAAILPLVAIVAQTELRRVFVEDVQLLHADRADFLHAPANPERDVLIQLMALSKDLDTDKRLKAYSPVIERYNEPLLYAMALREAHRAGLPPTQPRPASDKGLDSFYQKRLSVARQTVHFADRMIARDPQNAFPYLSKMCALLTMGQREQALKALQQSAECARYESYEVEWARVVATPSLTAETRTMVLAEVVFPHLTGFRTAFRHWRIEANRLEKQGNHAESLQITEHLMRAGKLMLRRQQETITPLVAASMLRIVWDRYGNEKSEPTDDSAYLAVAQDFSRYARQHGRSDLAEEAVQTAQQAIEIRRLFREIQQKHPSNAGVDPLEYLDNFQELLARRAGGVLLIWWISPLIAFWLLGKLLVFRYRAAPAQDSIGSWAIVLITASLPVSVLAAGILCLYPFETVFDYVMERTATVETVFSLSFDEQMHAARMSMVYPLALLMLTAFLVPTVRLARSYKQDWLMWSLAVGIISAINLSSAGPLNISIWLSSPYIFSTIIALSILLFGLISAVALLAYAFILRRRVPLAYRVGTALLWGLGIALLASSNWTWSLLWLASGTVLWAVWACSLSEETHREAGKSLYRFAAASLILALLCLWLYALNGYLSLPLRNAQHHLLNRMLTEGEMALWRELL